MLILAECCGYYLYIDPGTGSMLVAVFLGIIGTLYFVLKGLLIKTKFLLKRGSFGWAINSNKIPVVIFAEDKRYFSIFEPLIDVFENRKFSITYMTCSKDDPIFDRKYQSINAQYIGEGNVAYSKINLLNAYIVLSTTPGLNIYQWKKSKSVNYYIHILHAPNEVLLYKMFGLDNYDAVFLSGQYQLDDLRNIERIRNLKPKDVEFIGIPYLDYKKEKLSNISKRNSKTKITMLLAPTWGENGILKKFGSSIIDKLLNTGNNLIIRPHPQSYISEKKLLDDLKDKYKNCDIEWNNDFDNFDVLNRADIMISDYSGVIFDYALVFDKPVVYTDVKFDNSPYDAWWVDYKLWSFTILGKLGIKLSEENFENLKTIIDDSLDNDELRLGREQARSETWNFIGNKGERAVDYIINKYNELKLFNN